MQFPGFLELEPIYPSPYLIRSLFSNISSTLTVTQFFDSIRMARLRLDYGNSLLPGTPVGILQNLQNKAPRGIYRLPGRVEGAQLHWLPTRQRIIHKLLTLTYKCPGLG